MFIEVEKLCNSPYYVLLLLSFDQDSFGIKLEKKSDR